jgi:hypothetical protein
MGYSEASMTAVGISNAIIGFAVVVLLHGLLLANSGRPLRGSADAFSQRALSRGRAKEAFAPAPAPPPATERFADSFVVAPDSRSEMLAFANNDESWAACDVKLKPDSSTSQLMPTTPCQRAESKYTERAVVNTYANELASNGGDLGGGLRGFEHMSSMAPPW